MVGNVSKYCDMLQFNLITYKYFNFMFDEIIKIYNRSYANYPVCFYQYKLINNL